MDYQKASAELLSLAARSHQRSKSSQLKDLMPAIETAMNSGVPRTEILKSLSAAGLDITMNYFDVARRRIKKRQAPTDPANAAPSTVSDSPRNDDQIKFDDRSTKSTTQDEKHLNNAMISTEKQSKTFDPSAIRRIRNQIVDMDALAKHATKGKP